jgi:transglutaminase-like putative cysteine protease
MVKIVNSSRKKLKEWEGIVAQEMKKERKAERKNVKKLAKEQGRPFKEVWEEYMEENHEFYVEYSYVHTAKYHDVSKIIPDPVQPDFCTQEEAPHIVFTPYIRQLVESLTEGVTDPLEKARIFYDFITKNMSYTFMPSYFLLENIPDTCAQNFNGDCGVFALLFLTLCRCAGIPAQWQSGFTAEPDFCGGHDWVRFYVEPQGWLFADCSYGVSANRNENEARRKFYFGNLDPYRMVANSAFAAPFTVQKDHWRADPYDNQVGEMETAECGLTYEEYERSKVVLQCEEV